MHLFKGCEIYVNGIEVDASEMMDFVCNVAYVKIRNDGTPFSVVTSLFDDLEYILEIYDIDKGKIINDLQNRI